VNFKTRLNSKNKKWSIFLGAFMVLFYFWVFLVKIRPSFLLTFSWNDAKLFLYVSSCLVMLTKGELR